MKLANALSQRAELQTRIHQLETRLYQVPASIDDEIGRVKLAAMGLTIDRLTPEQEQYLSGWQVD